MTQIHQNLSENPDQIQSGEPFVVGIGASAGGLEALQQFFCCVPSNSGLSFVVIQHLAQITKA